MEAGKTKEIEAKMILFQSTETNEGGLRAWFYYSTVFRFENVWDYCSDLSMVTKRNIYEFFFLRFYKVKPKEPLLNEVDQNWITRTLGGRKKFLSALQVTTKCATIVQKD